jgi:hypothetical protein
VLVAAMPGGAAVRLATEEQLRHRGWPAALSPTDADVLLVAGVPAADIAAAVETTWAAVPAPRVRAIVTSPGEVAAALDAAQAELATGAPRWLPAGDGAVLPGGDGGAASGPGGSHGAHGMAGHHDMGDMDTGMPGGLPMAERGEDRDGLKLDRLHVPLGPVLPDWPAGLVVRLVLQGDVVQYAEAGAVGLAVGAASFWTEPWQRAAAGEPVTVDVAARRRAAAHLDSLGRFLAIAGWDDAATTACALRDDAGRQAGVLTGAGRTAACRAGGPVPRAGLVDPRCGDAAAR